MSFIEFSIRKGGDVSLIVSVEEVTMASMLTVEYLVDFLDLEEVSYIRVRTGKPRVYIVDGVLKMPFRILYNPKHPLVVFRASTQISEEVVPKLASKLIDWAERNEIARIVVLDTVPANKKEEEGVVYFATEK